MQKHKYIKLVTPKQKGIIWYQNQSIIQQKLFQKEKQIFIDNPVYLDLSRLEISKIVMYDFWYNHVKTKYGDKTKLCYMDADNFIVYIKTEDIFLDIIENVRIRLDT